MERIHGADGGLFIVWVGLELQGGVDARVDGAVVDLLVPDAKWGIARHSVCLKLFKMQY